MRNASWLSRIVLALVMFLATGLTTSARLWADGKGQEKLDEATGLKLDANTPAKLAKVIQLCEEAISDGLDDENKEVAKQFLAASAIQRAKLLAEQIPRLNNPNQLRRLRNEIVSDIKKAIEADPNSAEAQMLGAQVASEPEEAIKHVDKAIELLKEDPEEQSKAYMLRAGLQKDDQDARLNDLKRATEADPNNLGAWQLKVMLQLSLNKLEDAYKDIQKLLENEDANEFAVQAAFDTLLKMKKYDELRDILSKQIDSKPKDGRLYRLRGAVLIMQAAEKQGDKEALAKARPDLDKAIELNARDAQALVLRSQVLYDLGDLDQARRDISDALVINPDAGEGFYMRAAIAAREGQYDSAIRDMEMLVRAYPTRESYVRTLAQYYQLDDRPRLAIRLMDGLISSKKAGWRNLRMRGDARLSVGEHSEAIRDYESAISVIDKAKPESDKKEGDQPQDAADEENETTPPNSEEHAGLLNNLAWVLATSPKDDVRNGKRALELALKSCELTEYKAAHILSTLAAAYAETGDFEKAREWSGKAVELGTAEENEQLDQLKKELDGYKENKPWREEQKTEENKKQRVKGDTIET